MLERGGITDRLGVNLAGAWFEVAILLGDIIRGYFDKTKQYKPVTLACWPQCSCDTVRFDGSSGTSWTECFMRTYTTNQSRARGQCNVPK